MPTSYTATHTHAYCLVRQVVPAHTPGVLFNSKYKINLDFEAICFLDISHSIFGKFEIRLNKAKLAKSYYLLWTIAQSLEYNIFSGTEIQDSCQFAENFNTIKYC